MAFANRFGNLFKQAVNSSPSLYQAIRCMSSSKLFVGGLAYGTDDHYLREAFIGFGEVTEARVIMDRETGRSRGFGFVSFTSDEEANNAMSSMDGKELQGRVVRVNYATERTGGFRGGGGGGYGYGGGPGAYGGGGNNYRGGGDGYGGNRSSYGGDNYNTGNGSYGGNFSVAGGGSGSDSYVGDGMNNSYASTGQEDQFKDDDEYANRQ